MIYITGDTHGEIEMHKLSSKNFKQGENLTKDDFVIVTGDFGLLWSNIPDTSEKYWTKWLNNKPWTTLFIDGNHENFNRLNQLPIEEKWGGNVGVVSKSIYHLRRGEIYTLNDKIFMCFGGALSTDRGHRRIGTSYWEEEVPTYKEMEYALNNLETHDWKVNYIITHTASYSMVSLLMPEREHDPMCKFIEHILASTEYDEHYCGHLHMDRQVLKTRLLYNDILRIV